MSIPSIEEFNALKVRVAALESAVDAISAQLDDDFTNNSGALSDNYSDKGLAANDQYTVTNLKNYLVKFKDASGAEHTLGAAGGARESSVVTGLTAQITDFETAGIVSKAAL